MPKRTTKKAALPPSEVGIDHSLPSRAQVLGLQADVARLIEQTERSTLVTRALLFAFVQPSPMLGVDMLCREPHMEALVEALRQLEYMQRDPRVWQTTKPFTIVDLTRDTANMDRMEDVEMTKCVDTDVESESDSEEEEEEEPKEREVVHQQQEIEAKTGSKRKAPAKANSPAKRRAPAKAAAPVAAPAPTKAKAAAKPKAAAAAPRRSKRTAR